MKTWIVQMEDGERLEIQADEWVWGYDGLRFVDDDGAAIARFMTEVRYILDKDAVGGGADPRGRIKILGTTEKPVA